MKEISIILLAAGSSSRMGQSKQLLSINGEPLLVRSVKATLAAGQHRVVVVLGANEQAHQELIKDLPVTIVKNSNWQMGMGNSLKAGLGCLLKLAPETNAAIISVCDQPQLTGLHLKNLVEKYLATRSPVVTSFYSGISGVPALFDQSLFQELLSLDDEQGAKKVINQNPDQISQVNFPGGEIDLDTMTDYESFVTKR